jgi:hypothetical protein
LYGIAKILFFSRLHAEISPLCQQNLEPEELIDKILRKWELAAKLEAVVASLLRSEPEKR